jgi:hypothetical protein
VRWLARHGLDLPLLMAQPLVSLPAHIFVIDALLAAFVFLVVVVTGGNRRPVSYLWVPTLAVLIADLCCALPLVLAQRERVLNQGRS